MFHTVDVYAIDIPVSKLKLAVKLKAIEPHLSNWTQRKQHFKKKCGIHENPASKCIIGMNYCNFI